MSSVSSAARPAVGASLVDAYLIAAAIGAASMPALLAYNVPPSATFFNQAAALIGWGLVAVLAALNVWQRGRMTAIAERPAWPARSGLVCLCLALCIVAASAAAATLFGKLPSSLSLSAIGMIAATLVLVWAGAAARGAGVAPQLFKAVCIALVVAGLISVVIACLQVFEPSLSDGVLIARSDAGRASGNLRQPNHLSSLVVWSAVAAVWLFEARVIKRALATVLVALFVFTVALSASRTGIMELIALVLWGALDRRLSGSARLLLLSTLVMYVACWFGLAEWAKVGSQVYVGAERLKQADISSSRFAIWSNAITLIKMQPWLGTGFGQFNMAWTLTSFPQRPVEFFDHPHNLLLHLATELGVPLATVVTLMLCWALWKVFAASRRSDPALQALTRAAFIMIVTIATHSQLEYPLWYAYFLLPTGLLFGVSLGADPYHLPDRLPGGVGSVARPESAATSRQVMGLIFAGSLVVLVSVASLFDYYRVVVIFDPPPNAGPLMDRIADGEKSWFFSHHAGYADATVEQEPPVDLPAFEEPIYYLLDSRLMMAWADAYARSGDLQKASTVAARLREFRNADTVDYFAPCDAKAAPGVSPATGGQGKAAKRRAASSLPDTKPYQCVAPTTVLSWRDFR